MADIRITTLTEAVTPGADYYLLTDSATDGVKKVKTSNIVTKSNIGLGSVDNTSDLAKPISTAVQTALNGKASSAQGALADSAVQPATLGALALKNMAAISDIAAAGTADGSHYLRGDGLWGVPSGGGDVLAANIYAADRTALAALNGVTSSIVYLKEVDRAGVFQWNGANLSTQVTADPQQGVYVAPATAPTGASGAWVRQYNGDIRLEWFGAAGDGTTDDTTAIQAAINVVPAGGALIFLGP